jgi:hypothetical protein
MPTHSRLPEGPETRTPSREAYIRCTPIALSLRARVAVILMALAIAGCGSGGGTASEVDPTPEKIDGTSSYEFEQEDLDAAEGASDPVKEYCADAASEAQRLGCESHVTEDEIP